MNWRLFAATALLAVGLACPAPAEEKPLPSGRLRGIRLPVFNHNTGVKEWELVAKVAIPTDGGKKFLVNDPTIQLYSQQDQALIVSKAGNFDRTTEDVDLTGGVVMTLDDAEDTRIETPVASWAARTRIVRSEADVVITRKSMIIAGRGLSFGPAIGGEESRPSILMIHGNVHALVKGAGETASLFAPLQAEMEPDPQATPNDPATPHEDIVITCDGTFRINSSHHVATFRDNVRVVRGPAWLTSDRLTLFLDPQTGKLHTLLAGGRVVTSDPDRRAGGNSDRMLWQAETGSGYLTGSPAISWLGDVRGDAPRITFSTRDKSVQWERRASMILSPETLQIAPAP